MYLNEDEWMLVKYKKEWVIGAWVKMFCLGIAIIIGTLTASLFIKDWLDDRPFKFERYKDDEQFREALNKQFPLASDIREMMQIFEQSGAECYDRSDEEDLVQEYKEYEIIYWCEHNSGWFSLPPFDGYKIWFMGGKDYKLMHIYGSTYTWFII